MSKKTVKDNSKGKDSKTSKKIIKEERIKKLPRDTESTGPRKKPKE
ncbi:MAG: hypothetical protein P9M03_00330 [Candidatus Theseobacter exili]|nr:hypothetical protein [Candidatus Theseobacter exili]